MSFTGFPVAALDFYDDLEMDNTRSFWEAHRGVYEESVRAPMTALVESLVAEFAPDEKTAKVFRPYRDVRFSKDKTPYKEHQGGFVPTGPGSGYYVQVAAPGVRVSVGFYHAEPERLANLRTAIDDDRTGPALERLVAELEADGWERGGDRLKTSPRGWPGDHPRIDLLRHRSLVLSRSYGFEPVVHTPALAEEVRGDWRAGRPLMEWLAAVR